MDAQTRAAAVRLMIFDVDGVLTDGQLWYTEQGEAAKAFSTVDGLGLRLLQTQGILTAIVTGRTSGAVAHRAKELGVTHLFQGIANKAAAFAQLCANTGLSADVCGYMGDDLIDLPVMRRCVFAVAPPQAVLDVRKHAHLICQQPAGRGAAREACEFILRAQQSWDQALADYLR